MNKSELLSIRDYVPGDRNFILATFLRGLYYGESWFTLIQKSVFMEHYHKVITYLLDKKDTTIKVVCLKEDQDEIKGYAIYTGDTLHWIFIKKKWRKIGLARDLMPKSVSQVTHLTKIGLSIIRNKNIAFNPFAV